MDIMAVWSEEAEVISLVQGFADLMSWGSFLSMLIVISMLLVCRRVIRRRFWCAERKREVEVIFEERGLPIVPSHISVKSCSVFDPSSGIACARRCVHGAYRRCWPPALPLLGSAKHRSSAA